MTLWSYFYGIFFPTFFPPPLQFLHLILHHVNKYTRMKNLATDLFIYFTWLWPVLPSPVCLQTGGRGKKTSGDVKRGVSDSGAVVLSSHRADGGLERGTLPPLCLCQCWDRESFLLQRCFNPRCCDTTRTRVSIPLLSSWLSLHLFAWGKWAW